MDFSHMGYIMQGILQRAIRAAIADGIDTFYGGLAQGFDLIAAEMVVKEKYAGADIKLVSVAPFRGQELKWSRNWRARHDEILKASDSVVVLNDNYIRGAYHERNKYLVDHSTRLIALYNGKNGGTQHTVEYAAEKGVEIINIWDEICRQDSFTKVTI